ncbi:MAG TPA: permease prefix domain 1-containing protein, partial [Blastocatellia bacterium]|nr:permease prefix domain 1-containing protein [Blastocatellia bacterium]
MKMFRPIKRLKEIWRRYQFYRRRDQFDRELEAEMAFHIEMRARDAIDSGHAADNVDSASRAARRKFGNVTLAQERSRDMWTFRWLETLGQDIRYS